MGREGRKRGEKVFQLFDDDQIGQAGSVCGV